MPDAKVVPIGDGRPPRGQRAVLAGADRASGERARRRRRPTPLITGSVDDVRPTAVRAADAGPAPDGSPGTSAPRSPAARPATGAKETTAARKATPATSSARKKAATKKVAPKKAAPKKVAAKKVTAKKVTAKTAVASQAATKKVAAKQVTAGSTAAEEAATARTAPARGAAKKPAPPTAPRPVAEDGGAARTRRIEPARNPNRAPRLPRTTGTGEPVVPLRRPVAATSGPLPSGGRQSLALAIAKQAGEALLETVTSRARPADLEAKLGDALSFLRRRLTGEYQVDDFGFDPEFTEAVPLALFKPLYDHWFRVEVRGIENIPAEGGALIVANHSGGIPMDAVMTAVAVHTEHPQHRFMRALGADLVFQLPFVAGLARRSGVTLATNPDAERLLGEGHVVGVWPEGFKGVGKPFSERYKLQRFGRGGFVSAALRTGTPIIPCSIVGAEEIYPIISDLPLLARLLGLPYVPITPFFPWLGPLGAIPLPSKWLIEFGPPVRTDEFGPKAAEDPMLVFDLTDQVRQSIQQTLYSLLVQRRSIFF